MVETRGNLDRVTIDDGTLTLEGWAATVGAGRVEGFRVTCAWRGAHEPRGRNEGSPAPGCQSEPSPSRRELAGAVFRVRAGLNGVKPAQARSSVVSLTPLARRQEGRILIHLIEPGSPNPQRRRRSNRGRRRCTSASPNCVPWPLHPAGRPEARCAHVLDVGCGFRPRGLLRSPTIWRRPLDMKGFDIMGQLIEWAQQSISTKFPNFTFRKADIFNKCYNPNGALKAVDYRFPYEEDSFDLIFLTSVFTHLQGAEVRHYLDEIRRALRPGGKCLTTCFLLNGESEGLIREGKSTQNLVHPV